MLLKSLLAISTLLLITPMHDPLPDLQIGDPLPAPEIKMKDISSKDVTLSELKGGNGLLVIFSCNTCPFVIGGEESEGWEGRYPALGEYCKKNDIGMVLVNSNEAKRNNGDGFADMQHHYNSLG